MNNLGTSQGHQMVIYMSASPLNLWGTEALMSNLGGMVHIPPLLPRALKILSHIAAGL